MKKTIKYLVINIMAVILIFSLAAPSQAATYNDIGNHWGRDAIIRWESLGALADFSSGAFRPDAPITRAEFFSLLVHALGATEQADISRFTDVEEGAWYYEVVAIANKMRIAEGTSQTTMKPTENIIRQDAATLVARALGLPNENANYLSRYTDSYYVGDYARNYVSAVTEYGYMVGSNGNFRPRAWLSRAEAVKIVDNMFKHYYRPEVGFDNFTLTGNVISTRGESVFNGLTINGDLVLADGVSIGNATLNNCVINGRLLLRGGGPNSIVLNDTHITGGITVISPSSDPRIVTTGSTSAPSLTAFSGFTLSGTGVHSLAIADDAFFNISAALDGVMLDTVYVGGVGASIDLRSGRITNLHIGGAADGANCTLAKDTLVDYMSTVSPNTSLRGAGRVINAFINAPGALLAITPDTYTVGANLNATIASQAAPGQVLNTGNTVARNSAHFAVSQDSGFTGGENLRLSSSQGRSSNTVLVTQKVYTEIPLDNIDGRLGYYIGFFIPSPAGSGNDIAQLTYNVSDGGTVTMRDVSLTRKGGVYGLEFFVPVTRDGENERGRLNELLSIHWNNQTTENLQFHSGWLVLEAPTASQESKLLDSFAQSRFYGYDGTRYSGAEALRRLLSSDNPLGLDLNGFAALPQSDQEDLAARLYEFRDDFTSKEGLQNRLNQVITGKAALFAVNNAVTVAQMRNALENSAFAKELKIEVGSGSLYAWLSNAGKERVARTLLNGRSKDYGSASALKSAFDKAVTDARTTENSLLVALNAAKTAAEVQKIIEVKTNAEALNFSPALDPYKSCPADLKAELGQRILNVAPFYSVDEVARIISDFLYTLEQSGVGIGVTITGVTVTPGSMALLTGQTATFDFAVNTSGGVLTAPESVNITYTNPNVIDFDEETRTVYAKATGSAKITVTSVADPKKSASISVSVKAPIPSTGVTLDKDYVEIGEGESNIWLTAKIIPSNSTDTLIWTVEDPSIVGIDSSGRLSGLKPGFTTITVRTSSNKTAHCDVVVISKEPGVMIDPESAVVGIGQSTQLRAVVSPIDLPDRTVRWTTSDPKIATVDNFGKVTGVAIGSVTITAISNYDNRLTAECIVTVDPNIRKITLNRQTIVMVPTGIEQLTATLTPPKTSEDTIIWGTRAAAPGGPDDLVTVDEEGLVTAISTGSIYVYAYLESNSSVVAECLVQVLTTPLKLTVNPTSFQLPVGDTRALAVTFNPNTITNQNLIWSSSAPEIATVDDNGVVTGIKAGRANITGKPQASTMVTPLTVQVEVINIAVKRLDIRPSTTTVAKGYAGLLSELFTIAIDPLNATDKSLVWSSSDQTKINIYFDAGSPGDIYGGARIHALETTRIIDPATQMVVGDEPVKLTATASNGTSVAEVLISVSDNDIEQINNIKINLSDWIYPLGYPDQAVDVLFNVQGRNAANGTWILPAINPPIMAVTWICPHPEVAYVTEDNILKIVGVGSTEITARTQYGAISDTITIVVAPYGITSMKFDNLTAAGVYSDRPYLNMPLGSQPFQVNATILPDAAKNIPLIWRPYEWTYTESDLNDLTGTIGSTPDTSVIPVTTNGLITALQTGLVKVIVEPMTTYEYKFGSTTIAALEVACAQLDVQNGLTPGTNFAKYLAYNRIEKGADGKYYSPNEINLPDGIPPAIFRIPLNETTIMTLCVPNQMTEGSNEFFVRVYGQEMQSVTFNGQPASTPVDTTITLAAVVNPAPYVTIENAADNVVWDVGGTPFGIVSQSYDAASGTCYVTLSVPDTATAGTYNVKVTVTSATEHGLRSSWGFSPELLQAGKTLSATHALEVVAPSGAAGFAAPLNINISSGNVALPDIVTPAPNTTPPVATPSMSSSIVVGSVSINLGTGLSSAALTQAAKAQAMTAANTTYTSSNTAVAVVNSSGVITAVSPGSAVVSASSEGRVVTAQINVAQAGVSAATSKTLSLRGTANVLAGKSITLVPTLAGAGYDPSAVVWSSSKTAVATVDGNGMVYGLKAGKSVITATVPGTKLKATCTVTVSAAAKTPVVGITLSSSTLTLEAGKTSTLKATYQPTSASLKGVGWFSSDNAVAIVDRTGKVTAVAAGSAAIYAVTDEGGHIAACYVTVTPAPIKVTGITLNYNALTLMKGEQFMLEYTIQPGDAANQNVIWSTGNKNIVTVENGRITALKKGTATITVTTEDGKKKASCKVTVK